MLKWEFSCSSLCLCLLLLSICVWPTHVCVISLASLKMLLHFASLDIEISFNTSKTFAIAGIGQLKSFLDTEPTKFLEEKLGLYLSMKNIRSQRGESLTN